MKGSQSFWQGKVVLITGGSSGIGLAIGRLLASYKAKLWLLARNPDKLELARQEVISRGAAFCGIISVDVVNQEAVEQAIQQVEAETGIPDVVINSAGIVEPGYVQNLSMDIFRRVIEVNYLGSVCVTKACLPGMMRRKSGQVVLISSTAGYVGVVGYTAYSPSKYALRGFAEVLRAEMRYYGVGVSIVFPPDTDTPQLQYERRIHIPEVDILRKINGMALPEQVARDIVRGIERKRFLILPLFSNRLSYHVLRWLDTASFPLMDWLSDLGRRKSANTV